jgi:hypothetical protein
MKTKKRLNTYQAIGFCTLFCLIFKNFLLKGHHPLNFMKLVSAGIDMLISFVESMLCLLQENL